jgi:hypothetical protein
VSQSRKINSVVSDIFRPKQRKQAMRLLARNIPLSHACGNCGQPADIIYPEYMNEEDYPFFCEKYADEYVENDVMALPVVNSPSVGKCGYDGELESILIKKENSPE